MNQVSERETHTHNSFNNLLAFYLSFIIVIYLLFPGWVRAAVCFAALLTHHGIRDSLLTALPTIAAADDQTSPSTTELPAIPNPTYPQGFPPSPTDLSRGSQEYDNLTRSYDVAKSANLSPNTQHSTETTLGRGKQGERLFEGRGSDGVEENTPPPHVFQSLAGTEIRVSDAVEVTDPTSASSSSSVSDPTFSHEAREKLEEEREESEHSRVINEAWETSEAKVKITGRATGLHEPHREESDHSTTPHEAWKNSEQKRKETDHFKVSHEAEGEESDQFVLPRVPAAIPSFRLRTKTVERSEVGEGVPKKDHRSENAIPRPPLYILRGGQSASLHLEGVESVRTEPPIRRRERSIGGHLTEVESHAILNLVHAGSRHVQDKNGKAATKTPTAYEDLGHQLQEEEEEEEDFEGRQARTSSVEGYEFKVRRFEPWCRSFVGLSCCEL